MSDFTDFHAEALDEATDILGTAVVYAGATYQGIVNADSLQTELVAGGLLEKVDSVIILRKSDFQTAPANGAKVVALGREMRIKKVDTDEASYTLYCETAAK